MRKVYLLSTEHLENGLWFRDTEDFKVAMNYIAIEAACCPRGFVLAFILMSNHVHFLLKGRKEEATAFVNRFKRRYSIYYGRKYGVKEFLRGNGLDIKEIPYGDESVERVSAYVLMNCVAAGICTHPSQYPWGTGALYPITALPSSRTSTFTSTGLPFSSVMIFVTYLLSISVGEKTSVTPSASFSIIEFTVDALITV